MYMGFIYNSQDELRKYITIIQLSFVVGELDRISVKITEDYIVIQDDGGFQFFFFILDLVSAWKPQNHLALKPHQNTKSCRITKTTTHTRT